MAMFCINKIQHFSWNTFLIDGHFSEGSVGICATLCEGRPDFFRPSPVMLLVASCDTENVVLLIDLIKSQFFSHASMKLIH